MRARGSSVIPTTPSRMLQTAATLPQLRRSRLCGCLALPRKHELLFRLRQRIEKDCHRQPIPSRKEKIKHVQQKRRHGFKQALQDASCCTRVHFASIWHCIVHLSIEREQL